MNRLVQAVGDLMTLAAAQATWLPDCLPPVGRECEVLVPFDDTDDKWAPCVVIAAHYKGGVIVDVPFEEWLHIKDPARFRPIRTEAEKRREELSNRITAAGFTFGTGVLDHIINIAEEVYGNE